MKKIDIKKTISNDKFLHLMAGFIIATVGTFIFGLAIGITLGLLIGIGKELYDKFIKQSRMSFLDIFATLFGSVVGGFMTQAIKMYIL